MYENNGFAEGYAIGRDNGNCNNNGWGMDGAWWIVILLIFGWGGFGGGFGGFGGGAGLNGAKLVLESGLHPGELRDMVCSPGGTTIQGVRILEEGGMRGAVMDAVIACVEKSGKL